MSEESAAAGAPGATPTIGLALSTLSANWGWFVFRGILAVVLGVASFLFPLSALFAFTLVFAAWSGADGVLSLIAGIRGARAREDRWGALILRGFLGIAVAVLVALMPGAAALGYAVITLSIVAAWAILTGGIEIAAAIRLRQAITGEWLLALSGLLSLLLGAALFWLVLTNPLASLVSAAWLIGAYALFVGIVLIGLGLRLRGHAKTER